MPRSAQHPALRRRVVLVLDCLEDRHAPATISLLGQSATELIPARIDLDASAVGQFAVTAPLPVFTVINNASPDNVPFGFFHPFSQNGFGFSDSIIELAPMPQPRPVTPPPLRDPAQVLPEPELPAIPLPAIPRVENDSPAPALEAPPALIRVPLPELPAAPREQPEPQQVTESTPDIEAVDDAAVVTSASNGSRKSLASIGVLTAAFSLMYTRNARERRYDDTFAFCH